MIKNFKKNLILILSLIISIIVYEINYTKPLYLINMTLLKDNSYIFSKINVSADIFKFGNDTNALSIAKNKIELINTLLESHKKKFEGIVFYQKNSNEKLKQIYDICKKFQITYTYNTYHKVTCLTEQPKFAPKIIKNNINLIWKEISMAKSHINFNVNEDFTFIKSGELKISKTHNKIKNILKYSGAIIFFFLIFVFRKKILSF